MLLRTAAFKKSHLDFGNEDSALESYNSQVKKSRQKFP